MTNIDDLNQKLDKLLEEINLDQSPPKAGKKPDGWSWECDPLGNYLSCSPEVFEILGIHPSEFLGQPLPSFKLTAQSSRKLEIILGSLVDESHTNVEFRDHAGYPIPAQISIYLSQRDGSDELLLHGKVKILLKKRV
jgi:hypothetical protein